MYFFFFFFVWDERVLTRVFLRVFCYPPSPPPAPPPSCAVVLSLLRASIAPHGLRYHVALRFHLLVIARSSLVFDQRRLDLLLGLCVVGVSVLF